MEYPLNNKLEKLREMGFKISWKLIYVGLYGYNKLPALLSYEEMFDYIDGLLYTPNKETENIISLFGEKDDSFAIKNLLDKLVVHEDSDMFIQARKWKALLLKEILENISLDYFQGLLELMEFWKITGELQYCPFVFPETNDSSYLAEYFSPQTYFLIKEKNKMWLEQEIISLISIEKEKIFLGNTGDGSLC